MIVSPIVAPRLIEQVHVERGYQLKKWGNQPHGIADWLSIIAEELGEANRHAHETGTMFPSLGVTPDSNATLKVRHELIQVATCCLAALEECPDIQLQGEQEAGR